MSELEEEERLRRQFHYVFDYHQTLPELRRDQLRIYNHCLALKRIQQLLRRQLAVLARHNQQPPAAWFLEGYVENQALERKASQWVHDFQFLGAEVAGRLVSKVKEVHPLSAFEDEERVPNPE
ncbi:MAG: hypothetical protein LQ346_003769 [Caloplaca aetnensis]|nr:MAG: hypothetical protein LQ346_003769 [Caloplaca aetnensis]